MKVTRKKTLSFLKYSLFYFLIVVANITTMSGFRLSYFNNIMPLLEMIVVFFFSIYAPSLIRLPVIFVYGIILDIIYSFPMGMSAGPMMITAYLLQTQRRIFFRKEFTVVHLGFSSACLVYQTIKFMLISFYYSVQFNLTNFVMQVLMTILLYPTVHYIFQGMLKNFRRF